MGCKGVCLSFVTEKQKIQDRYTERKRCHTCEVWVITDALKCSCCGKRFRTKPR